MRGAEVDFSGRCLLGVFAHPDDESLACGGLLAWCAHLGARVAVLCATRGGASGNPRLSDARSLELDTAARVLGVSDVIVLDYEDGMLPWVDADALERDIRDAVLRLRPDTVITFGEDGLYWHPDHIAIHERTTAAVAALDAPPALYYVSLPQGQMRAVVDAVQARIGVSDPARSVLGVADVDAFGALAAPPTLVIETGEFAITKLSAISCHQTQLTHDLLHLLSPDEAVQLIGSECFRRADAGGSSGSFIEQLGNARSPA